MFDAVRGQGGNGDAGGGLDRARVTRGQAYAQAGESARKLNTFTNRQGLDLLEYWRRRKQHGLH